MTTKYSELADAEELRAESEPDDDDEPTEPEPDDEELDDEEEPEARGPTDADLKRFESENTRHEKALGKIVGDDWEHFAACAQCDGVGYVPADANAALPFNRDPQTEVCAVCDGYGTTLTGAREPGMVTRACSLCQGSGWTTVQEHVDIPPFVPTGAAPPPENGTPAAPEPPADPAAEALRARGYIVLEPPVVVPAAGS